MTKHRPTAGRYHLPPALSSAFQLGMESPVSALVLGRGLLLEILDVDLLDLLNKLISDLAAGLTGGKQGIRHGRP